ncbi:hypothetical protein FHETE_6097 [Fusarium heterosporum]|uniref:F-box domain-containing protein n=1 Tax=Fusarium heterosporum TaxID=42747 RepID=A0A8H5TBV4_FUSHE|nr:hypothetical protein FHETE_6097 [Fusarium heterosporum]
MSTIYQPSGLETLPPEIYKMIMNVLETKEWFRLMLTSKAVNHLSIPSFYSKLYTRQKTRCDTRGLVRLLTEKPWIKDLVRHLVIDVMDEAALDHHAYIGLLRKIIENKEKLLSYLRVLLYLDRDKLDVPEELMERAEKLKIAMWSEDSTYDPLPIYE